MKIFTACIGTETNTFAPLPTDQNAFLSCYFIRRGEHPEHVFMFGQPLILWKHNAEKRGWRVSESLCTFAMPSGITLRKTYENMRDEVIADLKTAMPVNAVMLSLHGAMVADGYDDCEQDLVRHIRNVIGPDMPLGVELDLHCHIARSFIEDVTAVVLFKEYPHVDAIERAEELWQIMEATLDGTIKPKVSVYDCRMIGIYHTTREPMMGFVRNMKAQEKQDGILSVSLAHCFPWADVPHLGARVIVVTDNEPQKGAVVAEMLGHELWRLRNQITPQYSNLNSAIDQAIAFDGGPVVLADMADNPGGGGVGDSTFIMRCLLDRGITDFAVGGIWDPVAVQIAVGVGEGVELKMRIGGKISPDSGDPLDVLVKVKKIVKNCHLDFLGTSKQNIGNAVCLEANGTEIIIHSLRAQNMTPSMFSTLGVDFIKKKILIVKSMQHFHARYAPIAGKIIYVAAPGTLIWDFRNIPYVKVVGPVWPLVEDPWGSNEESP